MRQYWTASWTSETFGGGSMPQASWRQLEILGETAVTALLTCTASVPLMTQKHI
jgi:hypothetical protein